MYGREGDPARRITTCVQAAIGMVIGVSAGTAAGMTPHPGGLRRREVLGLRLADLQVAARRVFIAEARAVINSR
jgi:hypothetical protein